MSEQPYTYILKCNPRGKIKFVLAKQFSKFVHLQQIIKKLLNEKRFKKI